MAMLLLPTGISVYGHSANKYGSVGTGFFQISFGGVEIELIGRRAEDMSYGLQGGEGALTHPTRVRVGNLWVRTITNPGQYARSR